MTMNENTEVKPLENSRQTDLSVSFVKKDRQIFIRFADGIREIPHHIIDYLGPDALEALAPGLITKTFTEFEQGFNIKVQKDSLNMLQRQFVSNHFGRRY